MVSALFIPVIFLIALFLATAIAEVHDDDNDNDE